ncbi:HEAT repeat domain-containing protein [Streptomyces sp. NPDC050842]|uniref:HEAT repeat domain-containing protein n=1 Tax=Streptomyces sp. NPDC050842 TaxID=3365636 RepID=UPI003789AAF8
MVVQDLCASAAIAASGDSVDETVLAPLLASRTGRVRAAGVTALRRSGRAADAEPFLYDRSVLVRACARWALRQVGTDPSTLYRAACAAGDRTPDFAPVGLAECGDRAADAPTLWSLIAHERPRVRAGAVVGLRLLDAVRPQRLVPLLDDSSPRVVREATKALGPWPEQLPAASPPNPLADPSAEVPTVVSVDATATGQVDAPVHASASKPGAWVLRVLRLARGRDRTRTPGT